MAILNDNSVILKKGGSEKIATVEDIDKKISPLAEKSYVDNKVLTNVPANAKFTDTTYTAGDNISIEKDKISVIGQLGLTEAEVKRVKVDKAAGADTIGGRTAEDLDNRYFNNSNVGMGESTFIGSGQERTITHGLSKTPIAAYATPKANPKGYLGEVWIRFDATNLYIGNTGSFSGAFTWMAVT